MISKNNRLFLRSWLALLIFVGAMIVTSHPVFACDGWICLGDILGYTEIAKQDADKQVQLKQLENDAAKVKADKEATLKQYDALANVQIEQAKASIEQAKALGVVAQANAQADADKFIAQVNERRAETAKSYDVQITNLQETARVMIAGINQAGEVKKTEVEWSGAKTLAVTGISGLMAFVVLIGAIRFALNRQTYDARLLAMRIMFPERQVSGYFQNRHNQISDKGDWT